MNIVLLPLLSVLGWLSRSLGWAQAMPNAHALLRAVWFIDFFLLMFNILPIYPLDGGQILRSLLWFLVGRARSLMAATIIGLFGAAGFVVLAVWMQSPWLGVLSVFIVMRAAGIPLNIATILIGSTVLGATENDQVHFFYHYQEGSSSGSTAASLRHALLVAGIRIGPRDIRRESRVVKVGVRVNGRGGEIVPQAEVVARLVQDDRRQKRVDEALRRLPAGRRLVVHRKRKRRPRRLLIRSIPVVAVGERTFLGRP